MDKYGKYSNKWETFITIRTLKEYEHKVKVKIDRQR